MPNLEAISYINLGDGNHPIDAVTVGGKTVPDVSDFITKSVNDLTNYYLKSETYTQEEVNTLIGNILQFHYEIAASTGAVSTPENNILYLIGPSGDGADKYEEYVYPNSTAGWTKIGDTTIDLTDYVSISMLNETLEDYKTSSEIEEIELIIAAALNDLNERLIYIEEDFAQGVTGQIYNVEDSILSLDSRVSTLETNASSYLTSEADPVFLSSPAASITASDISSWNAKQDALVYDSIPTENSDNLVKSGVLYSVLTRTEYITATAINDLNDRISDLESVDLSSSYVTISQYNDDEEVIAGAINEMDDRIQDLENSILTSEVDPIFSASAAAGISYTDITNWNSKTSNTGTLTDIIFNGVNASVLNGVASISYSVNLSDYVSLSDYESDEFVFATAINDLNDRITVLESVNESDPVFMSSAAASITASDIANWNSKTSNTGTLTGVKVNNISGTVSGGVASVSLTLDNISDGSTRKLADYVTYASYDDDQEVIAAAFNDLNGRMSAVESSALHAVTFNGTSASVSNGVASISASIPEDRILDITGLSFIENQSGKTTAQIASQLGVTASDLEDIGKGKYAALVSTSQSITYIVANHVYMEPVHSVVTISFSLVYGNITYQYTGTITNGTGTWNVEVSNIVSESTVSGWGFTKNTGTLTSESDPVFMSSPAASITASNISSWNAKQDALTYDSIPTYNSDNLVKSGVLYSIFEENEYVISTALNDLNGRMSTVGNAKIFYGTCSTAAATTSKVVTCSTFTSNDLVKGALIFVTFDNTNTGASGSLTMDVNDTTAKPIKKQYTASLTNITAAGELRANQTYLFAYDGTNWVCQTLDYNSNTNTSVRQYGDTGTITAPKYPILTKYSTGVSTDGYVNSYARYITATTINTSTGELEAPSIKVNGVSVATLNDIVPITGGTMSDNAILEFQDSDGYYFTQISHNGITLINGDDLFGTRITSEAITLGRWNGGNFDYPYTVTTYTNIAKYVDSSTNYTYTYPSKSGTFAMTDDIPAAVTSTTVASWGFLSSESDPVFASSVAASISAADISNWNSKTSNTGTVTGSSLTADKIVLGAGNSAIKNSTYGITTTAPSSNSDNTTLPTSSAVYSAITTALTAVLKYKGTAANNASLPASHSVGDVYVVSTAGTFAGKACEVGDYIICKTSGTSANNAHWDVVNGENQVDNKAATLAAAGASVSIATVDGTDITISTPSTWTGVDKTGTITGISMNGSSKGTSGNVDLGTVITAVSFNGTAASISNGVASITATIPTVNNVSISIQKNGTTVGTFTTNATTASTINLSINEMPSVSSADNGKVLQVVNGSWALVSPATIISGSGTPSNSTGNDGDLYLQTS